jgi:hypothetical protein
VTFAVDNPRLRDVTIVTHPSILKLTESSERIMAIDVEMY